MSLEDEFRIYTSILTH